MKKINFEQILLSLGIAITAIYFLNLIVLAALYPGYSHMRNYNSDLGRIEAPHHIIFNTVTIFIGLLRLLNALGFFYSIKRITGRKALATIVGIFVFVMGITAIFAGYYPSPDPRHGAYSIGLVHFFIQLLLVLAFWKIPDSSFFNIFQLLSFMILVIIMLVQRGIVGLINEMNQGLIQRLQAISFFTWYTFTCYWLLRYKPERHA